MESNSGSHRASAGAPAIASPGPGTVRGVDVLLAPARARAPAEGDPAIGRLRVPRLKALRPVVRYMAANSEPLVRPGLDRHTQPALVVWLISFNTAFSTLALLTRTPSSIPAPLLTCLPLPALPPPSIPRTPTQLPTLRWLFPFSLSPAPTFFACPHSSPHSPASRLRPRWRSNLMWHPLTGDAAGHCAGLCGAAM